MAAKDCTIVIENLEMAKILADRASFFWHMFPELEDAPEGRASAHSIAFPIELPAPSTPKFPPEIFTQGVSILVNYVPVDGFVSPPVGGTFEEWLNLASYLGSDDLFMYTFMWVSAKRQWHAVIPFLRGLLMSDRETNHSQILVSVLIQRVLYPDTLIPLWKEILRRATSLKDILYLDRLAKYTHYITGLGGRQLRILLQDTLATRDFQHFGRVLHEKLQKMHLWVIRRASAGAGCAVCHKIISIGTTTTMGYANNHVLPCCFSTVHMECYTKLFLRSYSEPFPWCPRCQLEWAHGYPLNIPYIRCHPGDIRIRGQVRTWRWNRGNLAIQWWNWLRPEDNYIEQVHLSRIATLYVHPIFCEEWGIDPKPLASPNPEFHIPRFLYDLTDEIMSHRPSKNS